MDPLTCLVTGSTGYIGGRLAPRLAGEGHRVRALVRSPEKLDSAPWVGNDTVVCGDLSDRDTLEAAFTGVDVVYHLVHSMGGSDDFVAEERRIAENVAALARGEGVRRIVYLSGLHPRNVPLSRHLGSRVEVGDILMSSGVETAVLQAGVVIGSGSASFELIRQLTERLPAMVTPRRVHNRVQPIAIRDVLHYLAGSATAPFPMSRTWDIGGPEVFEYGELMQTYAEMAGLPHRPMVTLPFLTPTIASQWVGTVTAIPTALARPLVESLECDAVMTEHDIDDVIPPPAQGLSTYSLAVKAALEGRRFARFDDGWDSVDPTRSPALSLPTDPQWAGEEVLSDSSVATTGASPDQVWRQVERLGGDNGWHSLDKVWKLRASVDALAGGPGLRERSRDDALEVGDALDWWTIDRVEPGRLLRLRGDTKTPGVAWMEIRLTPQDGGGTIVELLTRFYPRGLTGMGYWYGQLPAHRVVMARLLRDFVRAARR